MKIGCVCVSTRDQALDTQRSRLAAAGWKPAGSAPHEGCRRVTKLDRLARSPVELLRIAEVLIEKHAGLQFLDEPWADTTSAPSKMILTVFGGIAEFERPLILARMEEGRQAAKARGVTFGGLQSSVPTKKLVRELVEDGTSIAAIARAFSVDPANLLAHQGIAVLMTVFHPAQPCSPIMKSRKSSI